MVRAISDNNNDSTEKSLATFTTASATRMLPLVRKIVDDLLRLDHAIKAQSEQLRGVDSLVATIDQTDYQEELSDIRCTLDTDQRKFESYLTELQSLGLQVHLPFDGAVDFPSEMNRCQVQLCWHPGDDRVEYWHAIGQPTEQRRKLAASGRPSEST